MNNLMKNLIEEGWLKSPRIIEAFEKIKREDFLPEESKHLAGLNEPLPIGEGQTISQPLTVAFMLELLQPKIGDKILDIGFGSGWTSALLAEIVGKKGRVVAIELISELYEFGKKNVAKYNFVKKKIAKFVLGNGSLGYKQEAPYDGILVSATLQDKEIPLAWQEQLKVNGRLVFPKENSIWLFVKKSVDVFEKTEYPGFVFVPLKH